MPRITAYANETTMNRHIMIRMKANTPSNPDGMATALTMMESDIGLIFQYFH